MDHFFLYEVKKKFFLILYKINAYVNRKIFSKLKNRKMNVFINILKRLKFDINKNIKNEILF